MTADRSAGHPGYLALLDEMRALHVKKAADYGRGHDPLANCRGSAEFGIAPWVGTMVRAMDKVHRIKSYVEHGTLANEGVEDSLKDLAAYALIALVLFREQQGERAIHEFTPSESEVAEATARYADPKQMPSGVRVYIAGPISKGILADNLNQATAAFVRLAKAGLAPFCPHWSVYSYDSDIYDGNTESVCALGTKTGHPDMTHADWLAVDLPWVEAADAVLRLPGESVGADRETAHATERGIPVFTSVEELIAWA